MSIAVFQVGGSGTGGAQTTLLTTITVGRVFYPKSFSMRSNGAIAANQFMVFQNAATGIVFAQMYGTTNAQSLNGPLDTFPVAGGQAINVLDNITLANAWVATLTGVLI